MSSYALVDHLRSIDKHRIRRVFGRIAKDELAALSADDAPTSSNR